MMMIMVVMMVMMMTVMMMVMVMMTMMIRVGAPPPLQVVQKHCRVEGAADKKGDFS